MPQGLAFGKPCSRVVFVISDSTEDTLIVEQWGADYRLLRGKKIVEGTIDLIPGS